MPRIIQLNVCSTHVLRLSAYMKYMLLFSFGNSFDFAGHFRWLSSAYFARLHPGAIIDYSSIVFIAVAVVLSIVRTLLFLVSVY